jgi:hypothetical protein
MPRDGLFSDDAWVATGAVRGSPDQLITVGSGHVGFTGALMIWSRLIGASATALAAPALVAGVLGPGALYLMLRRFGYARSISALLGGTLAASSVHILYSGRVKTYVFDAVIVIALTLIVPRLARVRWGWAVAAAWSVGAVVVGSFSGFALAATALAGVILILHPCSDRFVRMVSVAAQGIAQLALFVAMQRSFASARLEEHQESIYDGHLEFDANPIDFGAQVLQHFRRVLVVFPGGPHWLLTVGVAAVLVGLVVASLSKREALAARFLALLLVFAFVGGVADRFPFGPSGGNALSRGERSTTWLIPMVAFGLAAVLQRVRNLSGDRRWLRISVDATIFTIAAMVVVAALQRDTLGYPFPGTESATEFLEAELRDGDVALLAVTSLYPVALEVDSKVTLRAFPDGLVGFVPVFADHRLIAVHSLPFEDLERVIGRADRVLVHIGIRGFVTLPPSHQRILDEKGFVPERSLPFGAADVVILRRTLAG